MQALLGQAYCLARVARAGGDHPYHVPQMQGQRQARPTYGGGVMGANGRTLTESQRDAGRSYLQEMVNALRCGEVPSRLFGHAVMWLRRMDEMYGENPDGPRATPTEREKAK